MCCLFIRFWIKRYWMIEGSNEVSLWKNSSFSYESKTRVMRRFSCSKFGRILRVTKNMIQIPLQCYIARRSLKKEQTIRRLFLHGNKVLEVKLHGWEKLSSSSNDCCLGSLTCFYSQTVSSNLWSYSLSITDVIWLVSTTYITTKQIIINWSNNPWLSFPSAILNLIFHPKQSQFCRLFIFSYVRNFLSIVTNSRPLEL